MVVDTKLYDILGVESTADANTIKKAYKKLAVKHHPDKTGGDDEKFKEINAAYKILSDEQQKAIYDQTGSVDMNSRSSEPDFDILSQLFGMGGMGGGFPFEMGGMGGGRSPFGPQKSPDMLHVIQMSLEDIYTGKKEQVQLKRNVICTDCKGVGGSNPEKCTPCKGSGIILVHQQNGPFIMQSQKECTACNGNGKTISKENQCKSCNAKGYKVKMSAIEVSIPAGAPNGYTTVSHGMADEKIGCESGDVHFQMRERQHERYARAGADLVTTVAIDLATALVGGIVQFQHLDGEQVSITLPKGKVVKHGDIVVVANRGMRNGNKSFGDLRVNLHISMPSNEWANRVNESAVRKLFSR